jgi:cytidyltransferase-like protein
MRYSVSLSVKEGSFVDYVNKKIIPPERIEALVAELRASGKTIATLNGSFDLLHAGHLEMIYQASIQADVLIVALNTDRSIQQYKSSAYADDGSLGYGELRDVF